MNSRTNKKTNRLVSVLAAGLVSSLFPWSSASVVLTPPSNVNIPITDLDTNAGNQITLEGAFICFKTSEAKKKFDEEFGQKTFNGSTVVDIITQFQTAVNDTLQKPGIKEGVQLFLVSLLIDKYLLIVLV